MQFTSWKQRAEERGTSVSTERRLYNSDPRYPRLKQLSPGIRRFVTEELDHYDRLVCAESEVADDGRPRDAGRFASVE